MTSSNLRVIQPDMFEADTDSQKEEVLVVQVDSSLFSFTVIHVYSLVLILTRTSCRDWFLKVSPYKRHILETVTGGLNMCVYEHVHCRDEGQSE